MEEYNIIVEWNIENFSFWRLGLHDKYISSSALPLLSGETFEVGLYPKGVTGIDEFLVVKIIDRNLKDFTGELSFIGSDGSLFCTHKVCCYDGEFLQGPKFTDVVDQIKKNDESHKGQLTLRFQFHQRDEGFEHFIMSTIIDVRKISLKLDQELIENIKSASEPKCIFRNEDASLKTVINGKTVKFMLEPQKEVNYTFLVETFISMSSSDDTYLRMEEQRRVFFKEATKTPWTFSESLVQTKYMKELRITLDLSLVFIKLDMRKNFSKLYCDKRVSVVQNEKKRNMVHVFPTADSVAGLPEDLMCLYQDQDFSDFQLKCGDVSFPVHRNILSARSPVFKTMLSTEMREATSGCMDIVDLDAPTLARFLTFLYSGAVEDLQCDSALKLYYAADKYQVPALKKECSNHLRANVSISHVCDILSLANRHQDQDLTEVSRIFVLNNYNEVLRSKEWESFCESESLLALKTLTQFGAKDCVVKKQEQPQKPPERPVLPVKAPAQSLLQNFNRNYNQHAIWTQ